MPTLWWDAQATESLCNRRGSSWHLSHSILFLPSYSPLSIIRKCAVSVLDTSGRNAGCRHGLLSIHKGRMYLSRGCRYRKLLCTLALLSNVDVYLAE